MSFFIYSFLNWSNWKDKKFCSCICLFTWAPVAVLWYCTLSDAASHSNASFINVSLFLVSTALRQSSGSAWLCSVCAAKRQDDEAPADTGTFTSNTSCVPVRGGSPADVQLGLNQKNVKTPVLCLKDELRQIRLFFFFSTAAALPLPEEDDQVWHSYWCCEASWDINSITAAAS